MTGRRYLFSVVAISVLGLWLRAPLLRTGFIVDDYAQLSMMEGTYPVARHPLALFTFTSGDPAENQVLKDAGFLPWWSHPALKISLFRPTASALMWFDRATFGDNPWFYHVHSAAWWLCMSVTWGVLARSFLPWGWALLVHALCTLHSAHGMLLYWIANRNASVAMFSGLLAILLQVRHRQHGARGNGRWAVPTCWALCLSAGEYGVGLFCFGLLYEVTGRQPAATKWRHLKPCLAVLLAYALLRVGLGFGSRESGMYIDPTAEPLPFLRAAIHRGPALIADLVLGLRSNWWSGGYPWADAAGRALGLSIDWVVDMRPLRRLHEAVGLLATLVCAWLIWFGQRQNTNLRFASLALPLALIAALGGVPESRLLLPAMFGWSLLQVGTLHSLLLRAREQRRAGTVLPLFVVLALVTLESKASFDASAGDVHFLPGLSNAIHSSTLAPTLDAALRDVEDAFLVGAVDPTTTIYIPMLRRWHHHNGPLRCHLLLSTVASMRLDRLGSNEFRVSRGQHFYTPPDIYAEAFRRRPVQPGQTFVTQHLQATVEKVHDGMPTVVRFKTARTLDSPALALLSQEPSGIRVLRFPAVGESLTIAPAQFPFELMAETH